MKKTILSLLVAVGLIGSASAQLVGVLSSGIVNPDNGHTFYLLENSDWTDAEAQAVLMGGHLATITNSAENQWVFNTFSNYQGTDRFLWLGLNCIAQQGTWVWSSGSPINYLNWSVYSPDNHNGNESYVLMYGSNIGTGNNRGVISPGTWNDVYNSPYPYAGNPSGNNFGPVYGVVEVVPEPSTYALFGIGAIALLIVLRRKKTA
ncbi:MAG: lectin-like protein [Verrucomicrobiota bacterium]